MKRNLVKKIVSVGLCLTLAGSCFAGCTKAEPESTVDESFDIVTAYDVNSADYQMSVDASNEIHDISDLLYGIFFEDINFSADGGLYGEMVANRSFEFTEIAENDQLYRWNTVNDANAVVNIDDKNRLNENNPNYVVVTNDKKEKAGIENTGFLDGMAVKEGKKYNISLYAMSQGKEYQPVDVRLVCNGDVLGEATIPAVDGMWDKYEVSITSNATKNAGVSLQVLIDKGTVAFDMISMFPENTYKNRQNGMRNDLATLLEALTPKFLRFPGGCVIEGFDQYSAYNWKDSVGVGSDGKPLMFNGKYGDVAARKQGVNVWTDLNATDDPWPSFMTYGLGFFEYFQLAEDIGAVGVPVINAGMFCQGRGAKLVDINTDEFQKYIQDMFDLVEFCRGDENTTWGKVRVDLGHPEPFELKYICVGNENWGDTYYVRYKKFLDAFNYAKAQNPTLYQGLELIYSAGPSDATHSEDYIKSYQFAKDNLPDANSASSFAGATDQHYYNTPDWFLSHADYYDEANYSRGVSDMTNAYGGGINVFLGEYASQSNTMYSALSEAAYMTGLERNGDIVRMTTYAPLFSSTIARHWAPNLIWFDNDESIGSTSYYIQKLFGNNAGTKLLDSKLTGANVIDRDTTGKVGVGTWNTAAKFDNITITNNETGETLATEDFSKKNTLKKNWESVTSGKFKVKKGALVQSDTNPEYNDLGSIMFFGDTSWSNYTYTFEATKLDGAEGFFIPFAVKDSQNCFFWNIGGWDNTVSCLQSVVRGVKTGQLEGTVKNFAAETDKTYTIKIVVDGNNFKGYIDDELYFDYNSVSPALADAYQVVSTDETGDVIVKLVNITDSKKTFALDLQGVTPAGATQYQVKADSDMAENVIDQPQACNIEEQELKGIGDRFNYTVPKYSATVIRIKR